MARPTFYDTTELLSGTVRTPPGTILVRYKVQRGLKLVWTNIALEPELLAVTQRNLMRRRLVDSDITLELANIGPAR